MTSSTRPLLLVASPPIFLLIAGLYGCGVLSVRELALRWGGGSATLLALGAAFGVLEEGLVASSFFDRAGATSTSWRVTVAGPACTGCGATYLTIFHAVFSVTIPVAITSRAYPDRREEPWLSARGRRRVAAGLVAITAIGVLGANPPGPRSPRRPR